MLRESNFAINWKFVCWYAALHGILVFIHVWLAINHVLCVCSILRQKKIELKFLEFLSFNFKNVWIDSTPSTYVCIKENRHCKSFHMNGGSCLQTYIQELLALVKDNSKLPSQLHTPFILALPYKDCICNHAHTVSIKGKRAFICA